MKIIRLTLRYILLIFSAINAYGQQINFSANVTLGCYPLPVNFTNTSSVGAVFLWDFGDGQSAAGINAAHTFVYSGVFTVRLKAFSAQSQYLGEAIQTIKVGGVNNFTIHNNDTVCPNENFYVGIEQQYDSLRWVFSDGTIIKNNWASHSFSNPGTYSIKLIVHTVCGFDSVTQYVTVTNEAVPVAPNFNIPGSQFCVGDQIQLYANVNYPSYHWDFDDGNTSNQQNPAYSYTSQGFRTITLSVTNVCGNSNSTTNYVDIAGNVPANANFNVPGQSYCPNEAISFNASAGSDFLWNFGDGNVAYSQNTKYLFADTGTYSVMLVVTNGCANSDTMIKNINIQFDSSYKPNVYAFFNNNNYEKDTLRICTGEEVAFLSWVNASGSIALKWDFGDGTFSTDKDPIHVFSTNGLHLVTLVAVNNCNGSDTVKKWVITNPNAFPVSNIMAVPDVICPGEKVYFFDDGNRMIGSGYNYSIWFGDGDSVLNISAYSDTVLQVVSHQYTNPGTYIYKFTVTNTCSNTNTLIDTVLVVNNISNPTFYYSHNSTEADGGNNSQDITGCMNDPISFMIVGGISYQWHFGDGTTSTEQNTYHSYPDTGIYNAFVIATNACGRIDTLQSLVTISNTNIPKPWFNVDEDRVCAGTAINFKYSDNSGKLSVYSFQWDFKDGGSSDLKNATHVFAAGGEYNVKLVVSNGCGSDSSFRLIRVLNPLPAFIPSLNIVPENVQINFTNQSENATSFVWDFGDGTTSSNVNPSHTYLLQGTYLVTLTASNLFGCTSFVTDTIFVHNLSISSDIHQNSCHNVADGYIDVTVTGGLPPYSYQWFLNDLSIQVITQDFLFNNPQFANSFGTGIYKIKVTDNNGMILMQTFNVVNPSALSVITNITHESCGKDGGVIAHIHGGTVPYLFSWSNNKTDSIISELTSGDYAVTITDANGCLLTSSYHVDQINNGGNIIQSIVIAYNMPACNSSSGSAWVQSIASSNSGNYIYTWNDAQQQHNDTAYNLSAGVYQVTITDTVTGCSAKENIALSNFGNTYITWINPHSPTCFGGNNGYADVNASTLNAPLTVAWSSNPPQSGYIAQNLTAGTYTVTVTDQIGCVATSSFQLLNPPELNLNISHTDPLCYGSYTGNATAHVTGGNQPYAYHWSNNSPYASLQNRNANTYSITVTDNQMCVVTSSVVLQNPQQLSAVPFIQDVSFYGIANGSIDITPTGGNAPFTYNWSNGKHTQDIEQLAAGTYTVTIKDANNCTATGTFVVNQPALLNVNITASGSTIFCYGDSVQLNAGSGYLQYHWSTGATTQAIVVYETGYYSVQCASSTSFGVDSIYIQVSHPYVYQGLCLVTVDTALGKNTIIWEKPSNAGIVSYNLYKETTFAGQFALMATLPYNALSMYVDANSNPSVHSDRYKISVIDTCGNESELSNAHKTMHLTVSTGVGVYNLIWENYEGFSFGSYTIYRGSSLASLLPIGAIQSNLTTYTDYQPIGTYFYQIAVMKNDSCWASSNAKDMAGPFSQSLSNIEDNGIFVDAENLSSRNNISVVPNPFSDATTIYFNKNGNHNYEITITDITGKIVRQIKNVTDNNYDLSRNGLKSGYYMIEVRGDKTYRQPVIVE